MPQFPRAEVEKSPKSRSRQPSPFQHEPKLVVQAVGPSSQPKSVPADASQYQLKTLSEGLPRTALVAAASGLRRKCHGTARIVAHFRRTPRSKTDHRFKATGKHNGNGVSHDKYRCRTGQKDQSNDQRSQNAGRIARPALSADRNTGGRRRRALPWCGKEPGLCAGSGQMVRKCGRRRLIAFALNFRPAKRGPGVPFFVARFYCLSCNLPCCFIARFEPRASIWAPA
jgi:hypothetical protein